LDVLHGEWQIAARRPTDLTDHHRRISIGLSPLLTIADSVNQKLDAYNPEQFREVCVRAGSGWKALFGISNSKKPVARGQHDEKEFEEVSSVLTICRDDIMALWEDTAIRSVLKKQNVRLEESPGL
jgi:guanine nucleotide-binding protein alpha-1 subunit